MLNIINIYLSTEGRINRKQFVLYMLPVFLISSFSINLINYIGEITTFLIMLLLLIPQIIISVKRLKDINTPPIVSLLLLIPIVSFVLLLYLIFKEGDIGDNQYGASSNNKVFNEEIKF